jgi:hypothetical protein
MRLLHYYPGLIGGGLGVLLAIVCLVAFCLFALWSRGASLARMQSELRAALERNQAACLDQIGQVGRAVEFLEVSGRNTEEAIGRAMNRSLRSQVLHLLRSGLAADTVAATLGVAKREVRLIAGISSVLTRTD